MKNFIKFSALVFTILTISFVIIYKNTSSTAFLTLSITFGTISYHFLMRLAVGFTVDSIFHNKIDYKKSWFCEKKFEKPLYKVLKVKKWKDKMPTFSLETFNFKTHSLKEIASAMCQAELVHLIIIILSFVPMFTISIWGGFWAFFITSVLSAILDSLFVIIQRYNRPRIVKMIKR